MLPKALERLFPREGIPLDHRGERALVGQRSSSPFELVVGQPRVGEAHGHPLTSNREVCDE